MTTTDFKTAFNAANELIQNSILDFLYVLDCNKHEYDNMPEPFADFEPRSAFIDFDGEVLPILQLLCPSFQFNGHVLDSQQKMRYSLKWESGQLQVPTFIIEESERQFNEWMELFGIHPKEEDEEEEATTTIVLKNQFTY